MWQFRHKGAGVPEPVVVGRKSPTGEADRDPGRPGGPWLKCARPNISRPTRHVRSAVRETSKCRGLLAGPAIGAGHLNEWRPARPHLIQGEAARRPWLSGESRGMATWMWDDLRPINGRLGIDLPTPLLPHRSVDEHVVVQARGSASTLRTPAPASAMPPPPRRSRGLPEDRERVEVARPRGSFAHPQSSPSASSSDARSGWGARSEVGWGNSVQCPRWFGRGRRSGRARPCGA